LYIIVFTNTEEEVQVVKKKKKDKTPSKETPKEGKKADKPKVWTNMYWRETKL